MEDSEKRERELEVDGQVSDNNLVAKFEQQQEEEEELPDAAVADDQNPGKTRSEGEKPDEEVPEDQELNENVAEVQVLVELPVHKAHRPEDPNTATATGFAEGDAGPKEVPENKDAGPDTHPANQHEPLTPNSLVELSNAKAEDECKGTSKNGLNESKLGPEKSTAGRSRKEIEEDDESGTPVEQAAFMTELESFYRERAMEFKPPRFYGKPLNCLKLWRAVVKLGGYDRITGSKLWRLVGESFHPPKTCTTISWTFRVFYEKALLDYERNKTESGELELAVAALPESATVDNEGLQANVQAPGSGRARRDAAAPAMQGRHAQRVYGYGEVGEPIIKDKTFNIMPKREKSLKSIGPLKHKRPREGEHSVKAARTETPKQLRL